jgi:hypothetical protein
MREGHRGRTAAGAALFFVVAPGGVVGVVPYLLSRWLVERRLPWALRIAGAFLFAAGMISVVESFVRFVVSGHGSSTSASW